MKKTILIIALFLSFNFFGQKPTVDYIKFKKYTTSEKLNIDVSDTSKTFIVFDIDLNSLQIYKSGVWQNITLKYNLQDVTNEGFTTTNNMIIDGGKSSNFTVANGLKTAVLKSSGLHFDNLLQYGPSGVFYQNIVDTKDFRIDFDTSLLPSGVGLYYSFPMDKTGNQTLATMEDFAPFLSKVDGGNVLGNLIIDALDSGTNVAGSNLTVKKQSTATGTNVTQFIDTDRRAASTPASTSANSIALVSRAVNNSTVDDRGITGANLVARHSGVNNLGFAYGALIEANHNGTGDADFINAVSLKASNTGTGTGNIDYLRGLSATVTTDNPNITTNYMQANHSSLVFGNGLVGNAYGLYLDVDYDAAGNSVVSGDLSYIYSANDALPPVTGNKYYINSLVEQPSIFSGSITAPYFIGDGSFLTNIDASTLSGRGINTLMSADYGTPSSAAPLLFMNFNTVPKGSYAAAIYDGNTNVPITGTGALFSFGNVDYSCRVVSKNDGSDNLWFSSGDSSNPYYQVASREYVDNNAINKASFYEEVTFTPTLTDSGGGGTYTPSSSVGKSIRNGNSVTVTINLSGINTTGTPNGQPIIGALPFLPTNGTPVNISYFTGNSDSYYSIKAYTTGTEIRFLIQDSLDGNNNGLLTSNTITGGIISLSVNYITNVYTP